MHAAGVTGEVVPLGVFVLLAALFVWLGVYLRRRPERAAALFADQHARRTFTARDARAVGMVYAVGGGVLLAVGVIRLAVAVALG